MKYFVYYADDYDTVGIEEFDTEALAVEFIEKRMCYNRAKANIRDYKLIRGQEVKITPVESVIRIKTEVPR